MLECDRGGEDHAEVVAVELDALGLIESDRQGAGLEVVQRLQVRCGLENNPAAFPAVEYSPDRQAQSHARPLPESFGTQHHNVQESVIGFRVGEEEDAGGEGAAVADDDRVRVE